MSSSLLIYNAILHTPEGVYAGWLLAEGGRIRLLGAGAPPAFEDVEWLDAGGLNLLPGFVDVHVHGAAGFDTMDASADGLRRMAQFYARHGVTAFLPTTWSDTLERIRAALEAVAAATGPQPDGATIIGAHMEGPYLNPSRCGAQKAECIRPADPDEALPLLELGVIRLLALAPEYGANHWLIEACTRRGITVSAAHTAATYEQMMHAAALGLTHATHTFNAMTGLGHREPGVVGAAMTLPQVRCELIADNIHVHPAAMRILFAAKGAGGVALVTDAVRAAGMPEGDTMIDDRLVTVKNGAVRLPDGTLAGSILTMDTALRNLLAATGRSLAELWPAASLNAARAAHVADRKGSLEAGKDADLTLVDDDVRVALTVAEGRIVFRDPARLPCI